MAVGRTVARAALLGPALARRGAAARVSTDSVRIRTVAVGSVDLGDRRGGGASSSNDAGHLPTKAKPRAESVVGRSHEKFDVEAFAEKSMTGLHLTDLFRVANKASTAQVLAPPPPPTERAPAIVQALASRRRHSRRATPRRPCSTPSS